MAKRILIFGMTDNPGGVESFLMNYYRNIDRDKLQFDFLINTEHIAYEEEIKQMGGRIFYFVPPRENYKVYKKEINSFFKEHGKEFEAFWMNVNILVNIDYLKLAKKYGIKRIILHSHNSRNMSGKINGILHKINRKVIKKYVTDYWACAKDAAKWFYTGNELAKSRVINNAINVDKFQYSKEEALEIRKQYGWEDNYIVGNIGRLHFQKNQSFMIDIFKLYSENNPKAILVLVGKGPDEDELKKKVSELGLDDKVHFVGLQKNIRGWLSTFDLFLFPSLFEGLSIAALEAQASGVPILASEGVITPEVKMNDSFMFFSLDKGAKAWSERMEELKGYERMSFEAIKDSFIEKGFEIKSEALKLQSDLLS